MRQKGGGWKGRVGRIEVLGKGRSYDFWEESHVNGCQSEGFLEYIQIKQIASLQIATESMAMGQIQLLPLFEPFHKGHMNWLANIDPYSLDVQL